MSDTLLDTDVTTTRPANVPAKFWDANTGEVRTDALLKSYLELEKKLGTMVPAHDTDRMKKILGVPESLDKYQINTDHGFFKPHPEINAELHKAGYTQGQAQLLYDLAARHMVPMIVDVANQYQSHGELQRLKDEFGAGQWPEIARQLQAWASANLPPEAAKGLSTTYDGVMALHKMMSDSVGADALPPANADSARGGGEQEVAAMMRDPRYWQKRDPKYVAKVTAAFERKYGTNPREQVAK